MTSALDQKGLKAATDAYNEFECGSDVDHVRKIVRAYLSTVIPADIAGVVAKLRFHGRYASETQQECTERKNNERVAAADRIEALEAWKAEAMEVLRLLSCFDLNHATEHDDMIFEDCVNAARALSEGGRDG